MTRRGSLRSVVAAGTTLLVVGAAVALVAPPAEAQLPSDQFFMLTAGQSVASANGLHRFVMQTDGNAVLYGPGGVVEFATGTQGHPGAYITQQLDGNLVVYSRRNEPLWANGVQSAKEVFDTVTDYGTVLCSNIAVSWSSGSVELSDLDASPGWRAEVAGGTVVLALQYDDNLVEYVGSRPVWATDTAQAEAEYANLVTQSDGNTVLYEYTSDNGRVAIWSTGTYGHPGADFVVQADTNLVVYDVDGSVLWSRF